MKDGGRENGRVFEGGGSASAGVVAVCVFGGIGLEGGSVKMTNCTLSSGIETS